MLQCNKIFLSMHEQFMLDAKGKTPNAFCARMALRSSMADCCANPPEHGPPWVAHVRALGYKGRAEGRRWRLVRRCRCTGGTRLPWDRYPSLLGERVPRSAALDLTKRNQRSAAMASFLLVRHKVRALPGLTAARVDARCGLLRNDNQPARADGPLSRSLPERRDYPKRRRQRALSDTLECCEEAFGLVPIRVAALRTATQSH